MKGGWPRVRLGEVLRFTPRPISVEADATYREIGIRSHGRGIFHKMPTTGMEIGSKKVFRVEPGDFVLNIVFAWEGATAVVSDAEIGMIGSHRFPTFCPDPVRLEAKYLLYFCQTWFGQDLLQRVSPGGAGRNRTLNRHVFLQQEVPLPPLLEQRRLVARIEELASQIREARSLRQQAWTEVEGIVTSLHSRLAGTRTRVLGELLELDEDSVPVSPIGVYPQVGVRGFGGGLFAKSAVVGSETTYKRFNRLYTGAVVLSQVKGWEGALAVCPSDLEGRFVSPEYRTFRCRAREALPGYVGPLFQTEWFRRKLGDATRGVGARRERTRPEYFVAIELPMPDVGQQERGVSVFAEAESLKRLQAQTTIELDGLLPAILYDVFGSER